MHSKIHVALRLTLLSTALVTVAAQQSFFDVASVKRLEARSGRGRITVEPGGRLEAPASTVRELVAAAYGLAETQVLGGPDWIANDRFEVMATTKADVDPAGARAMLRSLLADRFRVLAHEETRELPVYLLTMAREDRRIGPQLRASGAECAPMKGPTRGIAAPSFVAAPAPPPPPPPPGTRPAFALDGGLARRCPSLAARFNGGGHWSLREVTMAQLAEQFTNELGRPVYDRTRLIGAYDLDLSFASDPAVLAAAGLTDAPALLTAVRDQLGLRLESARAPVDVLVVDRVELPTEN